MEKLTLKITNKSPQTLLKDTGRSQYVTDDVVATMPRSKGEVTLEFFKLDRYVTVQELETEFAIRGLATADPISLLHLDLENREFVDKLNYLGTQWKDKDGKWCYATFNRWDDGRDVRVDRNDCGWYGGWWFAGVRKDSSSTSDPSPLNLDTVSLAARLDRVEQWFADHNLEL